MVIAIAIVRMTDLLAVVMLSGIYGLLSACFFVVLDAVDVAFTEASVGAGISGLLMLAAITMTGRKEAPRRHKPLLSLFVVLVTGGMLIYGTMDMPYFGAVDAPVHQHVAPRYIHDSMEEVGVPNIVTSVLGSYRAFDTLGEVAVILPLVLVCCHYSDYHVVVKILNQMKRLKSKCTNVIWSCVLSVKPSFLSSYCLHSMCSSMVISAWWWFPSRGDFCCCDYSIHHVIWLRNRSKGI